MDVIFELKEKYQIDLKFTSKPSLSFEDFKFEILERKEEEPEAESKIAEKSYEKAHSKSESGEVQKEASSEETPKAESEANSTQTKRRYSKRKPSPRRGQTRGRGRRPYNPRKKPENETPAIAGEAQTSTVDPIKTDEKNFNTLPDKVEAPIIPLPAPFVRSETTESETSGSAPDGNVSEG